MKQHLPDKKAIARSFSRKAGSYEAYARVQCHALQRLVAQLSVYPCEGGVWADLGSGPGPFEALLPEPLHPGRMVCLDIAGGALGRLDELGAGWVSGVRGDIEALPLRPGSFDRIIVASVLQWTADPLEVVSRCVELLRPGGQLLFSVFLAEYLRELDETRWRVSGSRLPIRLVDRLELLAVLEQAGLALVWEEHLHEVLYFPTALGLIKNLTGAGATATREGGGHPAALFALCRAYEKRYRTTRGVPATCDTLVGIAQRR